MPPPQYWVTDGAPPPPPSQSCSAVPVFCNRRQKLVLRSCTAPNRTNREVKVVLWMNHLTRIFTWLRQIWLLISEIASFMAATPNWTSWTLLWTVAIIALTIIWFNQTIFPEVKDLSSWPFLWVVLKLPVLPVVKVFSKEQPMIPSREGYLVWM